MPAGWLYLASSAPAWDRAPESSAGKHTLRTSELFVCFLASVRAGLGQGAGAMWDRPLAALKRAGRGGAGREQEGPPEPAPPECAVHFSSTLLQERLRPYPPARLLALTQIDPRTAR